MSWAAAASAAVAACIEEQRRQFEATRLEFAPVIGGWVPKTDRSIEQAATEHRRKIAAMERETTRWNWGLMIGLTALVVWTALMALGVTP